MIAATPYLSQFPAKTALSDEAAAAGTNHRAFEGDDTGPRFDDFTVLHFISAFERV